MSRILPRPLTYNTEGPPLVSGVYACRVDAGDVPTGIKLYKDEFLLWDNDNKRWWYPFSDQKFRGYVAGHIGPLQRLQPKR